MRRAIRGLAICGAAVVLVAVMLTWRGPSAGPDGVLPQVLGATIERPTPLRSAGDSPNRSTATKPPSALAVTTTTMPPTSTTNTTVALAPAPSGGDLATGTPATTTTAPAAAQPYELIDQAESLVRFDWRDALPGWTIEFVGARPGLRGATFPQAKVVQVYVRRGEAVTDIAHAFAHEVGHAVDVTYLDDQDRAEFNTARGRPADFDWWVAPAADDFASGAGDWAECFAWSMTDGVGGFYSQLGPSPSAAVMGLIAELDHG